MLPVRVPWNGFPQAIVHSSICKLKCFPEYYASKRGNDRAAAIIARAVVRSEKIDTAVDFIVPVIQVNAGVTPLSESELASLKQLARRTAREVSGPDSILGKNLHQIRSFDRD